MEDIERNRAIKMNFLREKSAQNLLKGILVFILLSCALDYGTGMVQKNSLEAAIINHDNAIVSSLLAQGISQAVISNAVTSTDTTEPAAKMLGKLGIKTEAHITFHPFITDFVQKTTAMDGMKILCLSLFLLILVIRYLSKQEQLYSHAIKNISDYANGYFSKSLPQSGNGSLSRLFSCINGLAATLKSKQEAEQATKEFLKSTISDISHQLKTPLSALSMYNEIILGEPENTEAVISFTQKSGKAIERMQSLILSLLKITRIDAGAIDFSKEEYFITEVINAAIENLTIRAEKEKKKLIFSGNPKETLFCDLGWTSEAIGNLVKNALDHTAENGEITIRWERTPMQICLSVADNGSGIAQEDFYHIFKRFYRNKNSSDSQGIGLGLPLVKAIAEGQGGMVAVQSEIGLGTEFSITLPYKTVS